MHVPGHDAAENPTAPQHATRRDRPAEAVLLRAAASGRSDVLGSHGLLAVQRAVGNGGAATLAEDQAFTPPTGGSPLDDGVRADMEGRLGADFSDVRVHTGDAAHAAATSVDALAYTSGSDVVFQNGQYDPSSTSGQTMLAHELTHVVQQRSGPVDGTDTGAGVSVSSPADRFEREAVANADRVMAAPPPVQRAEEDEDVVQTAPAADAVDEDEAVAQTFVQRHADHDHSDDEG